MALRPLSPRAPARTWWCVSDLRWVLEAESRSELGRSDDAAAGHAPAIPVPGELGPEHRPAAEPAAECVLPCQPEAELHRRGSGIDPLRAVLSLSHDRGPLAGPKNPAQFLQFVLVRLAGRVVHRRQTSHVLLPQRPIALLHTFPHQVYDPLALCGDLFGRRAVRPLCHVLRRLLRPAGPR